MSRPAAVLALALVATSACVFGGAPLPDGDRPLEQLALVDLDGKRFDPAALDGKVVVVNFWSPG